MKNKKITKSNIKKKLDSSSNKSEEEPSPDSSTESKEQIISDNFSIIAPKSSANFNNLLKYVKDIDLPKLIFSPSKKKQTIAKSEKSTCMLTILGLVSKKDNPYETITKMARDGFHDDESLIIQLKDEETGLPLMTFALESLRIAAIDFGDLSIKREKSPYREIKLEFDYETITVNNQTI